MPKPGDYCAVTIGRQPMITVRQRVGHKSGGVQVLYNCCPHRGVQPRYAEALGCELQVKLVPQR